ncbi:alpha/beta hydrolase [Patescibacteria group bacterium]|nr:alpha/beta hydrolase [Patescibacteria group bacterium]MBU0963939.1 alpha/beta hydrolase [Patescibacteria group bacterium]
MQKKFAIKNRRGLTIRGIMEWKWDKYGPLVILSHGLAVTYKQSQVRLVGDALAEAGYTVFRLTATNSIGESDGSLLNFTVSGYIQDIKTVMRYAFEKTGQDYCALMGYSVGAMASYIVAAQDERVKALVLQGPLYDLKAEMSRLIYLPLYKAMGWMWKMSKTANKRFRLGYEFYHDGIRYRPDDYLRKITCPSLVIYGTKELLLQKHDFIELYKRLRCDKKLVKISGAGHTFRSKKRISELAREVLKWLKEVKYENQA